MAIIGNNSVISPNGATSLPPTHRINDTDTLVCPPNQVITEFHFQSMETTGTPGEPVLMGVYDITSGANGAPLVASQTVTYDGSVSGVYSVTGLSIDISSYSGQTLAIALARTAGSSQVAWQDTTGHPQSATTGSPFDDPFVEDSTLAGIYYGVWAVTENASGITIDTEPTESRVDVQSSFVISGPAVAPTLANTSIKLVDGSGPAATINSITGSDPYTINYTFPRSTASLFNDVGIVHHITVDAESVDSSAIPYLPQTGWEFILLNSPDPSSELVLQYSPTPVTGDQWVYDPTLVPGPGTATYDAQGLVELSEDIAVAQSSEGYSILAVGTVQPLATIEFTTQGGGTGEYDGVMQRWIDAELSDGTTTTEKLLRFLATKGFTTGGFTERMYEYLKTVSSKRSNSERFKDWADNDFG